MGASLLNMNNVRHLKQSHLQGMRRIGMGFFSSVYARGQQPETVTKVTVDELSFQVLTCAAWRVARECVDAHFPRVLQNFGEVGVSRGNQVYAVELERLQPLSAKADRTLVRKWSQQYDTFCKAEGAQNPAAGKDWTHLSLRFCAMKAKELTDPYWRVFEVLHHFFLNYGGALDLKPSNFMTRDDGTLVWSDPVFDVAMLNRCTVVY